LMVLIANTLKEYQRQKQVGEKIWAQKLSLHVLTKDYCMPQ
jgi:hypothetical protein